MDVKWTSMPLKLVLMWFEYGLNMVLIRFKYRFYNILLRFLLGCAHPGQPAGVGTEAAMP